MTTLEAKKIVAVMMAAYPNYKPADVDATVNVWADILGDYTYDQISVALKAYVATDKSGYAPSVGQLLDKLQMFYGEELTEMEAWALVSKALRNGVYGADKEFDNLPPLVQKAVGGPSQLRNWAVTNSESVENVIQSNFIRTYRAVVKREKDMQKILQVVENRMVGVKENISIGLVTR